MERESPTWQQRLRDLAFRAGLPRFWRWWTTELAHLLPAAPRGAIQRRRMRPVLEFGEKEVVVWRPELADGTVKLAMAETIPLIGDAQNVAAAGAAAISRLPNGGGVLSFPKVVIALAPNKILRRRLTLPAAVEENVQQALAYDLDRLTPFRPEQIYFDAAIVGRDAAKKTLSVDWVAALKTVVDGIRRQVEDWGALAVSVIPGPVVANAPRLNLIPADERPTYASWQRWQVWAPTAIVAVLALGVTVVPLVQKRQYSIELMREADKARENAMVSDGLREQLTRLQDEYNFVLARKYAYPSAVQVLDDVTRMLPDDTWITQFDIKTTAKGKDSLRDLLLRGESANAGKLVSMLEESKLVEQAAPRSPTTKIQPGTGEVFDIGARLLRLPAPAAGPAVASAAPARPGNRDRSRSAPPAPAAPAPAGGRRRAAGLGRCGSGSRRGSPAAGGARYASSGLCAARRKDPRAGSGASGRAPGRRRAARSDAGWR